MGEEIMKNKKNDLVLDRRQKKNTRLVLFSAPLVFILGVILVIFGVTGGQNDDMVKVEARSESELNELISQKYNEIKELRKQQAKEQKNDASSEKSDRLKKKIQHKETQKLDLESELWKVKSGFYNKGSFRNENQASILWLGVILVMGSVGLLTLTQKEKIQQFRKKNGKKD